MINKNWKFNNKTEKNGTIIFLRRTDNNGGTKVMGHLWKLDENGTHRLVRATVDLKNNIILFHKLRRKDPHHHPYIGYAEYHLPLRKSQKN
jgi:hypothetical protein